LPSSVCDDFIPFFVLLLFGGAHYIRTRYFIHARAPTYSMTHTMLRSYQIPLPVDLIPSRMGPGKQDFSAAAAASPRTWGEEVQGKNPDPRESIGCSMRGSSAKGRAPGSMGLLGVKVERFPATTNSIPSSTVSRFPPAASLQHTSSFFPNS